MPSRQHRRFESLKPARKRFDNPYFRTRQSDRLQSSGIKSLLARISLRAWIYGLLTLVVAAALLWLCAFSNVFVIKIVEVKGVPDQESLAYERLVWEQSAANRFWMLPQSRLFVFNRSTLIETINSQYALESVRVIKKLPGTLQVLVTEKTPSLVWFEADNYYLIDSEGWIIRQIVEPVAELPVLYNNGEAKRLDKKIEGEQEAITAAPILLTEFKGRFSQIGFRQFVVDNNRRTITVVLSKGQLLYLSTSLGLMDQLDRFDLLLKQELKDELPKLRYVDMRYGDKIYYK